MSGRRCRRSRIRRRGGRHASASGRSRGSGSPRLAIGDMIAAPRRIVREARFARPCRQSDCDEPFYSIDELNEFHDGCACSSGPSVAAALLAVVRASGWLAAPSFRFQLKSLPDQPLPAARGAEFSADAFRAHVTFLADDLLEGRDTGSRGHEIAARYVATQFAALGLQPGGEMAAGTSRSSSSATASTGDADSDRRRPHLHARAARWRCGRAPDASALALEAPLVFAGYGLDMPAHGFDDYRGLDVRGRIVVVLERHARRDPERRRRASQRRQEADGGGARRGRADHGPHPRRRPRRTPWARTIRFADRPLHDLGRAGTARPSSTAPGCASPRRSTRRRPRPVPGRAAARSTRCSTKRRVPARGRAASRCAQTARVAREPAAATRFSSPQRGRRCCPAPIPASPANMCC